MLTVKALLRPGLGPVDFEVGDGACLAITGPSGAGKSLLLRAIVDLDLNTGAVSTGRINRAMVSAEAWRKSVAMLPAESGWWADDVLVHFTDPDITRDRLASVGLPADALDWQVARLSSGEKHRLALLRLLENDPEVLLLDEPTAFFDADTTAQVEALLTGLMAKGKTLIIVTHDKDQPVRLGAQVLRLEKGRVV